MMGSCFLCLSFLLQAAEIIIIIRLFLSLSNSHAYFNEAKLSVRLGLASEGVIPTGSGLKHRLQLPRCKQQTWSVESTKIA